MNSLSDIAAWVRAHYEIDVLGAQRLTDKVFKLRTQNQDYLLKLANDDDFVMKQLYAHKEMSGNVLPIYETRSGLSVAGYEQGFAYLTDYITQIPMPLEKRIADYAQLLGKLHHETGLDVEQHDVEITEMYHETYQKLEKNFTILEAHMQRIEMKISRSPFEWYVLMVYPLLDGMYRRADEAMQKFYRKLARQKQLPVAMTHGDVNAANILPSHETSYLINFEKSHFDIPARDLTLFLGHYHQLPGIRKIVTDCLKNYKNPLIVHDFFIRSLCVDVASIFGSLIGNSLLDISILNEQIAPGMVAMQIFDELKVSKQPKKKAAAQEEKQAKP